MIKKLVEFIKNKYKKITVFLAVSAGFIGAVFATIFIANGKGKPTPYLDKNYKEMLDQLNTRKEENEKIINNSGYVDFNDDGTIKSRNDRTKVK